MEEETYLSIDRFLSSEMQGDERLAFEERLKRDGNLAEKLELYRSASEILSVKFKREEKEAMFKHNLAKIVAEKTAIKEGKVIKLNWYALAAAASVALLCLVLFYTKLSKPDYDEFANYESITLVERGDENETKLQAQRAFNHHDYKFAVILFNKLLEGGDENAELELYKGIALLESDRINEANEMFYKVRNSKSIYKDRATWMLALSALKQKNYKKCESFLKEIPAGSAEYDNAQQLLDKL